MAGGAARVREALVLCGGLGTRLRPVVADRNKVVAEVAGRPFLGYVLDGLEALGIERAVLCTGHRAPQVRQTLGERHRSIALVYSEEETPLGTGGALAAAARRLAGDAPVLVANGDSVLAAPLAGLVARAAGNPAAPVIALAEVLEAGRYGRVVLDPSGRIRRFDEKLAGAGPGLVNAGVYLVPRALLDALPARRPLSLEREVFPAWVTAPGLWGWPSGGRLLDIGLPESYARAAEFLERERLS